MPRIVPALAVVKALTATGGTDGSLQVADTSVFQVADYVFVSAIGELPVRCCVLSIADSTHMVVGNDFNFEPANLSNFTVANGATVGKRKA